MSTASGVCTACEEDCSRTYVCLVCGEEKNLCSTMVGGFSVFTGCCTTCYWHLPPEEASLLLAGEQ